MRIQYLAVLLFIVASQVQAYGVIEFPEENLYVGGNVGSYDEILQERAAGAMVHLGYDLNRSFALEAHMGVTENVEMVDTTYTANAQMAHASVLLRGNLRKREYTLFGFAGHGWIHSRTKYELGTDKASNHDLAYGAGIDLYGSYTSAMTLKWMRLIDAGDEGDFDAVYLGFTHYLNAKHDRPYRTSLQ